MFKKSLRHLNLLAVLALLIVAALHPSSGKAQENPTALTYVYPAFAPVPKDLQAVQDAINAILVKKINATVTLRPIDGSAYDQKIKLDLAAGEKFDVIFTAPWINNYYQNVAQGNFYALDDLLKTKVPNLYAALPASAWDAARVNGKIYAVINQQGFPKPWGVAVRKDLAEKYKLDLATIKKYEDLEPFFDAIKKNEPDITPIYAQSDDYVGPVWNPETFGFDPVASPVAVRYDDKELKAVNMFDTPEFKAAVELTTKWYKAGYYPIEALPRTEGIAALKAGRFAALLTQWRGETPANLKTTYGGEWVGTSIAPLILTTGGIVATLNAVSARSANPEKAAQFLELLNTDPELYNLLANGIEGKHWVWVDKEKKLIGNPAGITADNNPYRPNSNWMFGNVFNAYYTDPALVGVWDLENKRNQASLPSTALGFTFSADNVKTESAQVTAITTEYMQGLAYGVGDPAKDLPEFLAKLKAAGIDKVVAETQAQLDAWKKAKN